MLKNLRLRDQSLVFVAISVAFLVLSVLGFSDQKESGLVLRSIVLTVVSIVALLINVLKVPAKHRVALNVVGGIVVLTAACLTLINTKFLKNKDKEGTIELLKSDDKTAKATAIVGTVAAGVAIIVGGCHLLSC